MQSYITAVGLADHRLRIPPMISYLAAQTSAEPTGASVRLVGAKQPGVVLPFLVSFHYFKRRTVRSIAEQFPGFDVPMLLDSGGFSAATLGERISLADYCRYIEANASGLEGYANLDSIGDPVKSARNFNIMLRAGFAPFPVFHVGSEWKYLDEILERAPSRMALGGMVPYLKGRQVELRRWLAAAFERIEERAPRAMVHGFGVGSSMAVLKDFPWHSVDSSAWTAAYQFRCIDVFDPARGEFVKVSCSRGQDGPMRHRDLLRAYGFAPGQFYPSSRYNYADAGALSLMSVFRAEQWVNEQRKERT